MKELVVISGKGGTGKTSITASFAALAKTAVLADCDVDAPDLHLILHPQILRRESFRSGHEAVIRPADCIGCGDCAAQCRFDAIRLEDEGYRVDPAGCEGCGVCVRACPVQAIDFPERACGAWYVSRTRCGPMVHARLNPGGENSGQLVARVCSEARRVGRSQGLDLMLVDGPPGIGCPVIASLTGATEVLVVTEPTSSGLHDLERVLNLTHHFRIPSAVCVNKWDINPAQADAVEQRAARLGAHVAGRIRYDRSVTAAQLQGLSPCEWTGSAAGMDIKRLWEELRSATTG